MRIAQQTKRFRRDYKKMKRSGKSIQKLQSVLLLLIDGNPLPPKYKDHALRGDMRRLRDCHIEGDWVLLYELGFDESGDETITFHATDTHENIFG